MHCLILFKDSIVSTREPLTYGSYLSCKWYFLHQLLSLKDLIKIKIITYKYHCEKCYYCKNPWQMILILVHCLFSKHQLKWIKLEYLSCLVFIRQKSILFHFFLIREFSKFSLFIYHSNRENHERAHYTVHICHYCSKNIPLY